MVNVNLYSTIVTKSLGFEALFKILNSPAVHGGHLARSFRPQIKNSLPQQKNSRILTNFLKLKKFIKIRTKIR